ncbi:WhiB family transcriptional regulator [Actinacidiphila glaucinigra]|uniref:WhiB family transcriptional regulator n=1 Tax=Actinacidiphila glaucinigra TaxID=235986 RepID=UPI0032516ECE
MSDWMDRARCRTVGGIEVMHHDAAGYSAVAADAEAKAVCAPCPVREQCLAYALELEGTYAAGFRGGIWGGRTAKERAAMVRPSRAKAVAA